MAKWYDVNSRDKDLARCKRCLALYNTVDAEKKDKCPQVRCGYDGNPDAMTKASLERIHGKG